MSRPVPPNFESWEQCRAYWMLEAVFLGQLYDRRPGPRNEKRAKKAAQLATAANAECAEPWEDEEREERGK